MIGAAALGALFAPGSAIAGQVSQIIVGNDSAHPVPVAGTVNVGNLPGNQSVSGTVNVGGGSLAATQSGPWTVGVSGPVATTSAATTETVQAKHYAGTPFEIYSDTLDVRPYRSVRVGVNLGANPGATHTEIVVNSVTAIPGSDSFTETFVIDHVEGGQLQSAFDAPLGSLQIVGACIGGCAGMDVYILGEKG